MSQNIGMEIEFARMKQGILYDTLQFLQVYVTVLNQKDKIVKIGFQASIHLAESNTVGISHVTFKFPNCPMGIARSSFPSGRGTKRSMGTGSTLIFSSLAIFMIWRCNSFG